MIEWTHEKPNGDITNKDRRDYIHGIFSETTYQADMENAVTDLLADLMHYCKIEGQDFEHALEKARMHFKTETEGEGGI